MLAYVWRRTRDAEISAATVGRLISVVIMISGVTLFFNLARALLTPSKVRFP
jgi:voltage-gated potassium channel